MTSWQAAICLSSLQRDKALSTYPRSDLGNMPGYNNARSKNKSINQHPHDNLSKLTWQYILQDEVLQFTDENILMNLSIKCWL